ncbi:MAG: condensation domain-containing protein, partial [Planctomycetota bacterium]
RRHESLRTSIVLCDGEPVQIVRPPFLVELEVRDLSALPADERDAQWRRLAIAEQLRPFDFAGQTFLRVTLLKLRNDEHLLLMTMHHIVCDRWSMHLLFQELSVLYAAHRQGTRAELPELAIQYGEYSRRQRDLLEGPAGSHVLDTWRKQLADLPPLDLPTDFPRPATISHRGARVSLQVPAHLVTAVEMLARRERATPFMVLLAAFQTLLHRYSGQTDFAVGSPAAGRSSTDVEPLIGFFINTLVLRANLADNPTFRDFLRQVRGTTLSALQFQEVPFEKLTEILNLPRDRGQQPLVQVMFALQNSPPLVFQLDGLNSELVDFDFGKSKFDLFLNLRVKPDGWQGFLEYRTDLFGEATARRMIGHYFTLLSDRGCPRDPHR